MSDTEWNEYSILGGIPVIAKRCDSHAQSQSSVIVAIHCDDDIVDFHFYSVAPMATVLRQLPTFSLRDTDITINAINELLYRDDVEHVIAEIEAVPFYDLYPSTLFVIELIQRWSKIRLPGWIYATMTSRGFALLKDIDSFNDGNRHAVGVTDTGIAVYRSNIQSGCTLCSDDMIFYMSCDNIDIETLAKLCCWSHATEICNVQRSLRRWIFQIALEKEK